MINESIAKIAINNLTVTFGNASPDQMVALSGLNLTVYPNEFLCVLGISGCGKTTLLNVLAGFIQPTTGKVLLNDTPIKGSGPDRGVVFQKDALFPWKTVAGNIEFGHETTNVPTQERKNRTHEALRRVGLSNIDNLYPHQLSGGMAQRVEIARALINDPDVLLLDEPFSKLDAQTRLHMQQLLQKLWLDLGLTVFFITHDIDEALFLADRIIILTARPARLKDEIVVPFARPRTPDVLTFDTYPSLKKRIFDSLEEEYRRYLNLPLDSEENP